MPAPQRRWETWKPPEPVVRKVDRLLDDHTYGEIDTIFNQRELVNYGLKSRVDHLRDEGLLTLDEIARRLGITKRIVRHLRSTGRLPVGYKKLDDVGEYIYGPLPSEIEGGKNKFNTKDTGGAI